MMTAHPANTSALLTFSHSVAKISQFTTQWKGNRVIALKQQISTSELNVELTHTYPWGLFSNRAMPVIFNLFNFAHQGCNAIIF